MITIEEIRTMTDEEVRAMNQDLGHRVVKRIAIIFAVKFAFILALNSYVRKKSHSKN